MFQHWNKIEKRKGRKSSLMEKRSSNHVDRKKLVSLGVVA